MGGLDRGQLVSNKMQVPASVQRGWLCDTVWSTNERRITVGLPGYDITSDGSRERKNRGNFLTRTEGTKLARRTMLVVNEIFTLDIGTLFNVYVRSKHRYGLILAGISGTVTLHNTTRDGNNWHCAPY